jgi:hypothetical protein
MFRVSFGDRGEPAGERQQLSVASLPPALALILNEMSLKKVRSNAPLGPAIYWTRSVCDAPGLSHTRDIPCGYVQLRFDWLSSPDSSGSKRK